MGKKAAKAVSEAKGDSEGKNLLGAPRFRDLGNGRVRCVATGHELPAHSKDAYSLSKHCRLGLIDSALSKGKTPLNMFQQDPNSRSKLICKLTGDIVNKNEQHIWKHINGKRFLNMLEQKEVEQQTPSEVVGKKNETEENNGNRKAETEVSDKKKKKKKQKQKEGDKVERDSSEVKNEGPLPEDDVDFWIPPAGDRWDNDDGGDRWGSDTEDDSADEEGEPDMDSHDLEDSKRKKRTSQETGDSSSPPSTKKVKNKEMTEGCV